MVHGLNSRKETFLRPTTNKLYATSKDVCQWQVFKDSLTCFNKMWYPSLISSLMFVLVQILSIWNSFPKNWSTCMIQSWNEMVRLLVEWLVQQEEHSFCCFRMMATLQCRAQGTATKQWGKPYVFVFQNGQSLSCNIWTCKTFIPPFM